MKILSTFNLGRIDLDLLHDEASVYSYMDAAIKALMDDRSPNPVIDVTDMMFRFVAPKVIDKKPFKLIKPGSMTDEIRRSISHRFTFWSNRNLMVRVDDVLIEDKDVVFVERFHGSMLDFNTAISQYYDKPKGKKS